jgi:CO/xanthine dehydrogenase Mo-binding subunit
MATFLLETALERLAVEAKEDGWEFRTRIWPFSEELGALDCGVRQCLVQRPTENYGLALGRNTRGGLQALLIFLSETGEWKGSCFVGSQPQAEATGLSLLALDAGVEQGLGLALTEVWHSAAETQGKWGKYGLYRQQGRPRVEAVWIGIADATESALTLAHAVKCLTPAALGCAWMRQSGQERFSWPMGKQGLFPRKRRR